MVVEEKLATLLSELIAIEGRSGPSIMMYASQEDYNSIIFGLDELQGEVNDDESERNFTACELSCVVFSCSSALL